LIYCNDFFYSGEIYNMYYDSYSKQIKFYLDGIEQDIPYLSYKYNVLNENYLRGKDFLATSILTLGVVISLFTINDVVDTNAFARNVFSTTTVMANSTEEKDFSTIVVDKKLSSSDFYKELYNNSDDEKKEILNLTKLVIRDNNDYLDQKDILNSFSSLKIVITSNDRLLTNTSDNIIGRYDQETNTLYLKEGLDEDVLNTTIFHEFLHFLSKSGFVSTSFNKNGYIGDALNEGMTQLLVNEYFQNQLFVYSNEVSITKAIVEIVGSDFMRECYFSHDLDSLINELSKYVSYEEVISLMKNMDNTKVAYNDNDRDNYDSFNRNCWDIIGNIYMNKFGKDMEKDRLMMAYKDGTSFDSVVSVSKKYFVGNEDESYKINYYYIDGNKGYLVDSILINNDNRYVEFNTKKKTTS